MMNRLRMSCLTASLAAISLALSGAAAAKAASSAASNSGQLTWSNKRPHPESLEPTEVETPKLDKTLPNAATGNDGFQIPPSPYGQVGNPYRRELTWSNKGKSAPPQVTADPKVEARAEVKPLPQPAPKAEKPPVELASNWTPAPTPRFEPKAPELKPDIRLQAAPQPKPEPKPEPKVMAVAPPEPFKDPVKNIDAPLPLPTPKPPVVTAEKIDAPPPKIEPQTEPKAEPKPQPKLASDGGYQLPPNSKYAGKVAPELEGKTAPKPDPKAVVAAQKEVAKQADAPKKDAPPKDAPKDTKVAAKTDGKDLKLAATPEAAPLAQAVEDEAYVPFVPGSRATNASQAPRYYSLHRAYGYEPDPAPHAGGELALDPTAVQTKDKPKIQTKDEAQKAPAPVQDTAQNTGKKSQ
ncbi:hypothetical protein PQU92_10400 [Asticcacaulis sp. BYS171W]|uniref:Uncharacterized protein n=1 Tax=Asticcacaulis aquaticus TaxID=2984212 RepID=A0ABT5HV20_9CAUL|nr:hypothetical protein [Asticcacaulis aquaticus]MDC7683690.1 hypothetical protein [Asticcacaulis aquaticus]